MIYATMPSRLQVSFLQTHFYDADGQVLRPWSAMKRVTTTNLDCKATTIRTIFPPTFKWKVKQTVSGSAPFVLLSLSLEAA